MNLVFLYYDNPIMLREQIECWNSYVNVLARLPTVIVVDDGSPHTHAADIVLRSRSKVPIKVFRIKQDIPWNFSGARNLGCLQSRGWIYVSDIDTLLLSRDAKKFFEGAPLDKNCFYIPKRVWLPHMSEAPPAIVNLLFHKEKYVEIGGYDEDYAGYYGREETDFYNRLSRVAKKIRREDVLTRIVIPALIRDARTITHRSRNKSRNAKIYARKLAAGFINPVNPLRFPWERVL
jgi:hypothetical protein